MRTEEKVESLYFFKQTYIALFWTLYQKSNTYERLLPLPEFLCLLLDSVGGKKNKNVKKWVNSYETHTKSQQFSRIMNVAQQSTRKMCIKKEFISAIWVLMYVLCFLGLFHWTNSQNNKLSYKPIRKKLKYFFFFLISL